MLSIATVRHFEIFLYQTSVIGPRPSPCLPRLKKPSADVPSNSLHDLRMNCDNKESPIRAAHRGGAARWRRRTHHATAQRREKGLSPSSASSPTVLPRLPSRACISPIPCFSFNIRPPTS